MADAEQLHNLKRKRTRERNNITRFANSVNSFTGETSLDDYEHYKGRIEEALERMLRLDDSIHDLLADDEYDADVAVCEDYIDAAKRAIQIAARGIDKKLSAATVDLTLSKTSAAAVPAPSFVHSVKLPPIKLEPFSGDVESWARFWEQFESSIDKDPSLPTVNKHVFLRGYLEGEPKLLVEGIAVSASTYEDTKRILRSRYGDPNRIIQAHLDYLEEVTPITTASPEALNTTFIECNRRIQALQALGEDVNAYGRVLAPKILRAFPDDVCRRWIVHVKREQLSEGDIIKLMEFLSVEVEGALTAQKIRGESLNISNLTPTAATFHISSKNERKIRKIKGPTEPFCVFCDSRCHWAQDCNAVVDTHGRIEKLKAANRCFLCLNRGHNARTCSKKGRALCTNCKRSHHRAICSSTENNTARFSQVPPVSVGNIGVDPSGFTHLQTARVWITGPTGLSRLTRCVLDCGSQSSFITKSIIDDLKLETIERRQLSVSAFEMPSAVSNPRRLVRLDLKSIWTNSTTSITAFESAHAFSPHPTVPHDISLMGRTRKMQLADPKNDHDDLPIEILIGGDHYWKIVKNATPVRLSQSLVLIPSKLGWILSGNRSGITVSTVVVNYIESGHKVPHSDDAFRRLWELDFIGITPDQDRSLSAKDSAILQQFHDSHRIEDNRRVVSLTRKEHITLPTNRQNAEKRFQALQKRLERDEGLQEVYYSQMLDYVRKGHVEIAEPILQDSNESYYLPHHLVKRERRGNIKWRIVFDGSSHEQNAPSLNDALEMGPNLLPESLSILLRFRLYPSAIIGDVSQAFLQLVLHQDDRDLTRFLWYRVVGDDEHGYETTSDIATYRFTRLPFGLTCSPFLLAATLRELADHHKQTFPHAASLLANSAYVDDFAAGAENEVKVIALYYELTSVMRQIRLPMAKWASNSAQLKTVWTAEGQKFDAETQVLGVDWNTETDTFSIDHEVITDKVAKVPTTKRNLLKAAATLYDPLGLASPVSIIGKILFQDTWCRGMGWDELLPQDLGLQWHTWVDTLPSLSRIHIPRYVHISQDGDSHVHVFCDASERAYGAVLYMRTDEKDRVTVQLLCSKNRLAPVKKVTLPRLELLAALIGARLLRYYCRETGFHSQAATLWTDSMVTLGWIRENPNRWKTFVCNRVTEIHTCTTPSQWRHCPGENNPADHLSRGITADRLMSLDEWWHGPSWLSLPPREWPQNLPSSRSPLPDEKRSQAQPVLLVGTHSSLIEANRFSSYWKLIRTTAWIFRFKQSLLRRERLRGELTAVELAAARTYWIQTVQEECFAAELLALRNNTPLPEESKIACFNPFLDSGLIRLGGRLHFAPLTREQRHPLLLDGQHHFTELLIQQTHIHLHHLGLRMVLSELRDEFWILRARQTIKKVLHRCLPCKIARNHRGEEIEAPLPADRLKPTKPFAVTGVDFAGPLYVKVGSLAQKAYIVLFTCATTRALHLELASDMSTDKFLMAFRRFSGRRGIPHTIYSDNARTFHAASKELTELSQVFTDQRTFQHFAHKGISWKFIASRAAWWGGWWERMVGTVKRCLRKVLGKSQINEETLGTILVEVEAAINSRPIVQDDSEVLTPSHFLNGERLTALPTGPEPTIRDNLRKEARLREKMQEDFLKRWQKEYLLDLRSYHQVRRPKGRSTECRVGDIVLLQDDLRPRHMWQRAWIHETRPGRDGKVRTVILRTANGTYISRPVQLVIPLEIDQGGEDVED